MISSQTAFSVDEVCAQVKKFGYAPSQCIRIYGEEFEVLSDPFPTETGIAIQVRSKRSKEARVLLLPNTIIHRVTQRFIPAA